MEFLVSNYYGCPLAAHRKKSDSHRARAGEREKLIYHLNAAAAAAVSRA
jgi:hypothetical protein